MILSPDAHSFTSQVQWALFFSRPLEHPSSHALLFWLSPVTTTQVTVVMVMTWWCRKGDGVGGDVAVVRVVVVVEVARACLARLREGGAGPLEYTTTPY